MCGTHDEDGEKADHVGSQKHGLEANDLVDGKARLFLLWGHPDNVDESNDPAVDGEEKEEGEREDEEEFAQEKGSVLENDLVDPVPSLFFFLLQAPADVAGGQDPTVECEGEGQDAGEDDEDLEDEFERVAEDECVGRESGLGWVLAEGIVDLDRVVGWSDEECGECDECVGQEGGEEGEGEGVERGWGGLGGGLGE